MLNILKKTPLRVYFAVTVGILVLIVALMLISRIFTNHQFIKNYNEGTYEMEKEEKLLEFNFPESYIPHYNLGNASYKKGDYEAAIGYYKDALANYPTDAAEADIRVNLALSMCNTIDFNHLDSQEKIDTALFILYQARDVLLEKDYATDNNDGRDADAQQLKNDIDKLIEQLKNPESEPPQQPQQEQNSGSDDDDSSSSSQGPQDKEKKIQGELEEKKKDALDERKQDRDNLEKWSDHVGGDEEDEEGSTSGSGTENGTETDDDTSGGGQKTVKPW